LKVVAYTESKPLADALAQRLGDGLIPDRDRESDMKHDADEIGSMSANNEGTKGWVVFRDVLYR
jgi:hypothetical protein